MKETYIREECSTVDASNDVTSFRGPRGPLVTVTFPRSRGGVTIGLCCHIRAVMLVAAGTCTTIRRSANTPAKLPMQAILSLTVLQLNDLSISSSQFARCYLLCKYYASLRIEQTE